MKMLIYLYVATVVVLLIFQQCNSQSNHKEINPLMRPQIDSLLTAFSEGMNKEDSIGVFVILKNVDANTLKIYLVAKKVLKSDFKIIGTPVTSDKRNGTHFYFYSGMEKLLMPDISFWNSHPEIFNDSLKQVGGLFETPIVKKVLYIFEGNKIIKPPVFDDLIFVDNPVDSIKFH